jgi:hypothetical protein
MRIIPNQLEQDRVITLLDKSGNVLITEHAKSKARRISIQGRADQRQIDTLYQQHPTAASATIKFRGKVGATFVFNGVRSRFVFE